MRKIVAVLFLIFFLPNMYSQCISLDSVICKHTGKHMNIKKRKHRKHFVLCIKQNSRITPITNCVDAKVFLYQRYLYIHNVAEISTLYFDITQIDFLNSGKKYHEEDTYGREYIDSLHIGDISFHVKGNIIDGKLEGIWMYFDSMENLLATFNFENGKRNGISKKFYLNGSIYKITNYIDGEKSGEEIEYDQNGNIIERVIWLKDRIIQTENKNSNE